MKSFIFTFLFVLVVALFLSPNARSAAVELDLSRQSQPLFFVVTSPTADPSTKAQAHRLANHLSTISGAKFLLTEDSMDAGIYVGTITDFPESGFDLNASDTNRALEYVLRSMETGLYVIGASPAAVQSAVGHVLRHIDAEHFPDGTAAKSTNRIRITIDHSESSSFALPKPIWSDN